MKKRELELIQMLSTEDRAKEKEKCISVSFITIFLLSFLGLGIYYWFGQDFIFSYSVVTPFWGFVIFTILGFIFICIIDKIYLSYWFEYNKVIKDANKEISNMIKSGDKDSIELNRLKKEYIERKIGKEPLTEEEFDWHTSIYCWGCGKKHISKPILYPVRRERTERWKDGIYRYSKTFHKSSSIRICPECYDRFNSANKQNEKNSPFQIAVSVVLAIAAIFASYQLWGENGAWICVAAIVFGGYWALLFLAVLILTPFLKSGNHSSKWNFDEIPEIRNFLNQELPHSHN